MKRSALRESREGQARASSAVTAPATSPVTAPTPTPTLRRPALWLLLAAIGVLVSAALYFARSEPPAESSPPAAAASSAPAAGVAGAPGPSYVGGAACVSCHE